MAVHVMSEEDKLTPSERMKEIEKRLRGKRSLLTLRGIVSEVLGAKPSDLKEFKHKINNHNWRGIVYQKRNILLGSIFSFWDTKVFCLRAYPKIKYADDSRCLNKEVVAQEKVDGTNLSIFKLPDGSIILKTRMNEYANNVELFKKKGSGITYLGMLQAVRNGEVWNQLLTLLEEHPQYVIFGELYGSCNPGDFVKYSVEIDYQVFDIIDREAQRFFPPSKVYEVCEKYSIPHVKEVWRGILTSKEIERIEFELKDELKDDGVEGWVSKTYLPEERDCYFAKLKCEEVKERCWERTSTIPTNIIRKAIRKTRENFPEYHTIEDIEPHVIEELKEDVEDSLIKKSLDKIRSEIRWILTPNEEDLFKLVVDEMENLRKRGIDLRDKKTVLSNLANKLGDISAGKLYRLYLQAVRGVETEGGAC